MYNLKNKKAELAIKDLLARQDYLVVQGNDLAKSFGGLKSFEQRVLDYCFSYVRKDSKLDDEYEVSALEIIKHFNLNKIVIKCYLNQNKIINKLLSLFEYLNTSLIIMNEKTYNKKCKVIVKYLTLY